MSRRHVLGLLVVALLGVGGWALARHGGPGARAAAPDGGPFAVAPAGPSAVLLDTKSGKTWVLTRSVEGQSVWLPAKRIDSGEEARDWRQREEEVKRVLTERNRAEKK